MTNEKLESIAYAQGWVEEHLQTYLGLAKNEDEKKYRQELYDAFMIVSEGFDGLRREHSQIEIKLQLVRNALQ